MTSPCCFAARLGALLGAAALAACGGGGADPVAGAATTSPAARADGLKTALSFTPPTPIPANANTLGMWSPVYNWPVVAVHSALLPDGRVMTYGSDTSGLQTGNATYDIWDSTGAPDAGHLTLPNGTGTDIFCSSQLLLPLSGQLLVTGGDLWTGTQTVNAPNNNSNLFDPTTNRLTRSSNMLRSRWYASSTTLINGETYIQGGSGGADRPEIRGTDGSFRLMTGIDTSALGSMYPRNFVTPDGRLFGYDPASGQMYTVATGGAGSLALSGRFNTGVSGGTFSSTAMYRPGKILQLGGTSNGAYTIDITDAAPVVAATQSMSSTRAWVNATLLADGKVLATSGSAVPNESTGFNNIAETWDPATGQWTQGAVGAKMRLYHSNALLLPDASVLVAGGGATQTTMLADPNKNNLNAELYYPPYLFTSGGARAARPSITTAPTWIDTGKVFTLGISGATGVSRVTLVKTGSTSHSFNMDQRFTELTFRASGGRVAVQAPTRAGEATPGYYMVFVFNEAGVPSVAKIVRMGIAADPNPATVPVLVSPGAQLGRAGNAVNIAPSASDPNGDTLGFAAAGLPPGLAIDAATGRLTGTPTSAGSYNTVLTVSDGVNVTSASFTWTVQAAAPLVLQAPPTPAFVVANGSAAYTASATGGSNLRYRWDFGDGTAPTAWLASASTTHAYASGGLYTVTLSVTDDSGALQSRSFQQAVYLPTTAARPAASTPLLELTAASGNAQLWNVNPDNDSVSVFDAITGTRLAEIGVGTAPRTLARAANGPVWVINKQSATITVIDAGNRAVLRTLALPRGSQPYGVVMAPSANLAYVALEASGQVLRFDTASYAQTGSASVGANVRHLSISADGAALYAARFITPPLPGEGTASVAPTAATGGEVVRITSATMAVASTVVLRNSTKADAENQGRGIPNYLGAAAISPDGTQAWVPSKQDNVGRGTLRDGAALNSQNTVRAVSSRVVLASASEDFAARIDHDNASLASAAAFDPRGVFLFVALETSRELAVVNAFTGAQLFRVVVGRAPQGLAVSNDGTRLYVGNFMDRSVSVLDLKPLLAQGVYDLPALRTLAAISVEKLAANVLVGKQLFYDARDTRLSSDRYMSCASCHNDGGHDGRTWDLRSLGEGLRNTAALRGRGGAQGRLHWSASFDEVQDFETQIRALAGGTGLMSDAQLAVGTRSQPLGDTKAGVSADLDALAAYVASLKSFAPSPLRTAAGALTTDAVAGKTVFAARCASCHGGADFSDSASRVLRDIGTLKPTSGQRLGRTLNGIDTPTLRDAWSTAPYLHDGSAATLEDAIRAHGGLTLSATDLATVAAYTRQIGSDETAAPASTGANLTVRALATLADTVGALFQVQVGGVVVGRGQLDATGYVDLLFDTSTFAAGAGIDILYTNDASIGAEDRSFAVQSITLNTVASGTTTIAATSAGVTIDAGVGAAALDGLDTFTGASTGGSMSRNAAIRFKAPAAPVSTNNTIVVRASTTLAGGVGAAIELRVNGALVGTRTLINTAPTDLSFAVPAVLPGDRIDVVFTNDAFISGADRNLYVESVTARGISMPATAAGVTIDVGTGATATDGLDVVPASNYGGWVPWNAAMRFALPAAPGASDTIVVRAAASLAGGVGAQMQVRHKGVLIGSMMVGNTAAQDFSFTTAATVAAGDRIDVVFTNDAFIGTQDRNLFVTSVRARDVTLLPGDSSARLDPGDGAAAFDGVGAVAGGTYGGALPWNAAMRLIAR